MTRAVGEFSVVADLPEWLVLLAAPVTVVGSVGTLFAVLGLLYWFGASLPGPVALERTRAAFGVSLGLGALALTTALKETFRYPRPAGADEPPAAVELLPELLQPLYGAMATADGFGFPSGHAIAAVVVYGGLALLVGRRRGYLAGAALIVAIAASRVVIEVHYLADVLAGFLAGGAYLAVAYRLSDRGRNPGRALSLALVVALAGAVVGGYGFDTMAALGATLGARITWGGVGEGVVHGPTTRSGGAVAAAFGFAFGAMFAAVYALDVAWVAFLGMGVVLGGTVAAPVVGEGAARRLALGGRRSASGTIRE